MQSEKQYSDIAIQCKSNKDEIDTMLKLLDKQNAMLRSLSREINTLKRSNKFYQDLIMSSETIKHLQYMKSILISRMR